MIPFEFEYYKPETIKEAVDLFTSLKSAGKEPMYYGGGTEFISMARMHNVSTGAVIDIKGIPECNRYELDADELIIGAAVTLTNIAELDIFPLLSLAVKRIADHTIQGKITLGGNIAGTIIYKEALLPLMVSDGEIIVVGPKGRRRISANKVFDESASLKEGEFILQVVVKDTFIPLAHLHVKRTKNEKIGYPLVTIVTLKNKGEIRMALSGLYENPFRSTTLEKILNDHSLPIDKRIDYIIKELPDGVLNDLGGSKEYRKFMLESMLEEVLENFQEEG